MLICSSDYSEPFTEDSEMLTEDSELEGITEEDIREKIWSKKKQSAREMEATSLLLLLREKYDKRFADKKKQIKANYEN